MKQSAKQLSPREVTLAVITACVILVQFLKASDPNSTPLGIMIDFKSVQSSKAPGAIFFIVEGRFTFPEDIIDKLSNELRDLIKNCLQVNPAKRLSAKEALKHPIFNKFT